MANNFPFLLLLGAVLLASAFILFILSIGLVEWSTTSDETIETTLGLWRHCTTVDGETSCEDLPCPSDNFHNGFCGKAMAARAFLTLACVLSGACAMASILYCAIVGDRTPRALLFTKKGLAVASLVVAIIGVALGISATMSAYNDMKFRLNNAAIIGIAGVGANLLGVGAFALTKPYF